MKHQHESCHLQWWYTKQKSHSTQHHIAVSGTLTHCHDDDNHVRWHAGEESNVPLYPPDTITRIMSPGYHLRVNVCTQTTQMHSCESGMLTFCTNTTAQSHPEMSYGIKAHCSHSDKQKINKSSSKTMRETNTHAAALDMFRRGKMPRVTTHIKARRWVSMMMTRLDPHTNMIRTHYTLHCTGCWVARLHHSAQQRPYHTRTCGECEDDSNNSYCSLDRWTDSRFWPQEQTSTMIDKHE